MRKIIPLLLLLLCLPVSAELVIPEAHQTLTPEESHIYPNLMPTLRHFITEEGGQGETNTLCGIVYAVADGTEFGIWFWPKKKLLIIDQRNPQSRQYNERSDRLYFDGRLFHLDHDVLSDADYAACIKAGGNGHSCLGYRLLEGDVKDTQADCAKNGKSYVIKPF